MKLNSRTPLKESPADISAAKAYGRSVLDSDRDTISSASCILGLGRSVYQGAVLKGADDEQKY